MDDPSLERTIGYQLVRAAKAHRQRLGPVLEELGLHVGQELVLVALADSDGLHQSALAERLGVEPPTVTKTLRKLEDSGLVERFDDPDDGRAQRVVLTDRGDDLVEDVVAGWTSVEEPMVAGFTDEERLLLRRMLLSLRENLGERWRTR